MEKHLEGCPITFFLDVWKERNRRAFRDSELSEQAIKLSFFSTLFIRNGSDRMQIIILWPMISCVDWISSKKGEEFVFCFFTLFFCLPVSFGCKCIHHVYFVAPSCRHFIFIFIISACLSRKRWEEQFV